MTSKALLLAGGRGERLRPITSSTPKCLVPIGGRTLLDYWVAALLDAGVREAVINTHHLADQVRRKLERVNATTSLRLHESYEGELLGSAGTLTHNRQLADGASEILVICADNLSDVRLEELLAFHRAHELSMSMLLFRANRPQACGIASLDATGTIVEFVEKPAQPKSNLANAGIYVMNPDLYREVADYGAFDIGADVLPRLLGRMKGYLHSGYHIDIGTHEALARARTDFASARP
ncbi:MAG TPA: nucleotidyltransferase family protein [Polyangiaceae bacterium]|nr:nucleotidyltransferase family protein [Polyangiaceae bacterium]